VGLAGLWGPPSSPPLLHQLFTALRIASSLFIQVDLIRGLRIDAPAYIYLPAPPPRHAKSDPESRKARDPNPYFHRIRASNQEKISP
jgi:hypothetical protein